MLPLSKKTKVKSANNKLFKQLPKYTSSDKTFFIKRYLLISDKTVGEIVSEIEIKNKGESIFFLNKAEVVSLTKENKNVFTYGRNFFVLYKELAEIKILRVFVWAKAGRKYHFFPLKLDNQHIWRADMKIQILFKTSTP